MDAFLYFASLIEDKEVEVDFYQYQFISFIVVALKKGFFDSHYDFTFPELNICGFDKNESIINFETNTFTVK